MLWTRKILSCLDVSIEFSVRYIKPSLYRWTEVFIFAMDLDMSLPILHSEYNHPCHHRCYEIIPSSVLEFKVRFRSTTHPNRNYILHETTSGHIELHQGSSHSCYVSVVNSMTTNSRVNPAWQFPIDVREIVCNLVLRPSTESKKYIAKKTGYLYPSGYTGADL